MKSEKDKNCTKPLKKDYDEDYIFYLYLNSPADYIFTLVKDYGDEVLEVLDRKFREKYPMFCIVDDDEYEYEHSPMEWYQIWGTLDEIEKMNKIKKHKNGR